MINVVKYRGLTALSSFLLITSILGFAIYKYQTTGEVFRYSVDFTGGAQMLFRFSTPVSTAALQETLDSGGWEGAILREFGNNEIMVRTKLQEVGKDLHTVADRMKQTIEKGFPSSCSFSI